VSDTNTAPSTPPKLPPETPIGMPAGLIFGSWAGTATLCAGAAYATASIGLLKSDVSVSATLGSLLVSVIMLIGLLAMAPGRLERPRHGARDGSLPP